MCSFTVRFVCVTVCFVSAAFLFTHANLLDIRLPPSIVTSPIELKIYRSDDEITLECVASGVPPPQYEWKKDGRTLSNPANIYHIVDGTIQIRPLTSLDEGHYQCVASNQFGAALSRTTVLRRAVLSPYPPPSTVYESPLLQEGMPHTLNCNPTKCVPKATYSWAVTRSTVNEVQQPIIPNKRIQIDDEGHLHFSYLTMADMQDKKLYKCNMYNPYVDMTIGGSYTLLNIKSVSNLPLFPPTFSFSTPSPVIALEGKNVSLRCFFSGNPEPSLQWTRVSGSLPIGRHQITNYNTELTIRDVQQTDEGDYICRGANPQASRDHPIQIDVQAVPVFRSVSDGPRSVNMTEGDTVTMSCNAYAEPAANIVWFQNGLELNPSALPPKYQLKDDNRKLVVKNLCKDCPDGSSDLAVIQCNASNVHGYAFSDGYINVLERTVLVIRPVNVHLPYDDTTPARFDCVATSDDSTPHTIRWYHVREDSDVGGAGELNVYNITGKVLLGVDGSLTITLSENSSDWSIYRGVYRCRATNGYSSDEATVRFDVDDPIVDSLVALPRAKEAGLIELWWILPLVAAIMLLVILLICCCICLQRNRGDSYPVDKKERKNGNDPEKEVLDSGFHDYQRPEGEVIRGSRASLSSSMKMESDSEEASLNEYGDIDGGKFTEDGSFIGDYGTDRRPRVGHHV